MICEMMPAKLMESLYFAEFLECVGPNSKLPSRRKYMRDVKKTFEDIKTKLILLLSKVKYVATTGIGFFFCRLIVFFLQDQSICILLHVLKENSKIL